MLIIFHFLTKNINLHDNYVYIYFYLSEHINLTDEHLFVFYSTLLELQKILESALVLTKKNAGEKMEETEAESQNIRKMVPLLTKMR